MIEVNYSDYKRILEENMRLIPENHKLKEEVERLNKGYCKFKEQCGKYATCLRENQLKEIERLNNIINELAFLFDDYNEFSEILKKYNYELKDSDKE